MQLEKVDLADLAIIYGIHGKLLTMSAEAVYTGSMLKMLVCHALNILNLVTPCFIIMFNCQI